MSQTLLPQNKIEETQKALRSLFAEEFPEKLKHPSAGASEEPSQGRNQQNSSNEQHSSGKGAPPAPGDGISRPEQLSELQKLVKGILPEASPIEVKHEPLPFLSFASLLEAAETPPPQTVVENFLRRGDVGMIGAKAKEKKSMFVAQLALAVESGRTFLSLKTEKTKVLLIDGELRPHDLGKRLKKIAGPNADSVQNLLVHSSRANPESGGFDTILEQIKAQPELDDVGFFIFDPLYRYIPAGSEMDCAVMQFQLELLQRFASERDAAVLLVHHFPKGSRSSNSHIEQTAGSSVISRMIDSLITLTRNNSANCTNIEFTTRHFQEPEKMVARWFNNRFMIDPSVKPDSGVVNAQTKSKRKNMSLLLAKIPSEGIPKKVLQKSTEEYIKKSTCYNYLKELEQDRQIRIEGEFVFKVIPTVF
ncbi:MAG: AAA family ATPase [Verrucomicrobiales bacterium]|nr:AAA family ATPase [Verrucomicrobiales bacterium]